MPWAQGSRGCQQNGRCLSAQPCSQVELAASAYENVSFESHQVPFSPSPRVVAQLAGISNGHACSS